MRTKYRAFREGQAEVGLYSDVSEKDSRRKGILSDRAELLWEIEADSFEEASAIFNIRMGFEPFVPQGESEPCPKCGANYYPSGSGECWSCGHKA